MRWRLQRVSVSPEEVGLCGCWQFIAVWREQKKLRQGKVVEECEEYSFYATSAARNQYSAPRLLQFIRDHWSATENGSHYRRDVSLGQDASKISGRTRAYVMATLRNLVGPFRIGQAPGQDRGAHFPGVAAQADQPSKDPTPHPKNIMSG